jgi:hypothetical protein
LDPITQVSATQSAQFFAADLSNVFLAGRAKLASIIG